MNMDKEKEREMEREREIGREREKEGWEENQDQSCRGSTSTPLRIASL